MGDVKPKRHQLSRRKGYRKPDGVVSVSRPGKFGNPFKTADEFRQALDLYLNGYIDFFSALTNDYQYDRIIDIAENLEQLRGKDLACWCGPDKPCHADVLIEFANRPPTVATSEQVPTKAEEAK